MPTRQDVASKAGVSGATVSRVYNTPALVDAATREKVRAAAAELGFVPDRHASALRRKTSNTLLLVEIEGSETYRWPGQRAYQSLYGEIIRSLVPHLQTTAWHLRLVTLPSPSQISSLAELPDFAGILGFDVNTQEVATALASLGKPVVCAHHGDHLLGVSTVTTDNRAGGGLQARWLQSRKLKNVAYLTGLSEDVRSHHLRQKGFLEVLPKATLLESGVGLAEGRDAATLVARLARHEGLQAVACVNDLTALGLIQGLAREGVRVPQDLTVVGYDNLVLTEVHEAGLPTVEAHLPKLYITALDALILRVQGNLQEIHELLAPEFVSG